jgi:hypothetical protein
LNVVDEESELREGVDTSNLFVARVAPSVQTEETLSKFLVALWQ